MSKFTKYDSAIFPTIEESILHASTNPKFKEFFIILLGKVAIYKGF